MPKLMKAITVMAPVDKVFAYVDKPANLPEIWPSLFEVKDIETLPNGGHRFGWHYNMAGKRIIGETETYEHVANKRIVDKAKGDLESTFVWTFDGENGTTKVNFEADYTTPMPFLAPKDEKFFLHRNELEADTLLSNLKARLEV